MDAASNPRAVAGDNQPPLAERLALDHADLLKRAQEAADLVPAQIRGIQNEEEAAIYTDTARDVKAVLAEADIAFKLAKQPWLDGGRTVEGFFAFRATLKAAADRCVAALNAHQRVKLEAQRKADAEAAERARKEAEAFDETPPVVAAPTVVKEAARVVSFTGAKATASIKWKGEVVDPAAVPRQYLMVNQSAIDAAIKGGARGIPGVRIFKDVRTAIR